MVFPLSRSSLGTEMAIFESRRSSLRVGVAARLYCSLFLPSARARFQCGAEGVKQMRHSGYTLLYPPFGSSEGSVYRLACTVLFSALHAERGISAAPRGKINAAQRIYSALSSLRVGRGISAAAQVPQCLPVVVPTIVPSLSQRQEAGATEEEPRLTLRRIGASELVMVCGAGRLFAVATSCR